MAVSMAVEGGHAHRGGGLCGDSGLLLSGGRIVGCVGQRLSGCLVKIAQGDGGGVTEDFDVGLRDGVGDLVVDGSGKSHGDSGVKVDVRGDDADEASLVPGSTVGLFLRLGIESCCSELLRNLAPRCPAC